MFELLRFFKINCSGSRKADSFLIKNAVKCIFLLLFFAFSTCNQIDLWENNYSLPDVTITSASANNVPPPWSITFAWDYPPITDMSGLHITCTDTSTSTVVHTGSVGQSVTSYTINSGLVASQRYNINMRLTDKWGKSSQGINFAITTQAGTIHFIYNEAQLDAVRLLPADTYNLMADLDLLAAGYNNWSPINPFTGVFEGNGHIIRNLTITTAIDERGLFGQVHGTNSNEGIIRNVHLVDVDVTGNEFTGGLIAYIHNDVRGLVYGCSVTGTIAGSLHTGGLIGQSINCDILSSYAIVTITSVDGQVGGLIGRNNNSSFYNSYAVATITAVGYTGGLIGYMENDSASIDIIIDNCHAAATVNSSFDYAGGLIGFVENTGSRTITIQNNCYAEGIVNNNSGNNTGGPIGYLYNFSSGSVILQNNCYATATVNGTGTNTGGLIGLIDNADVGAITLQDCHTSGTVDGSGGHTGGLIGRCTNSTADAGVNGTITLNNCRHTIGAVTGSSNTGGLIGSAYNNVNIASITLNNCDATSDVKGATEIGGLIGSSVNDSTTVLAIKLNYCFHTTGITDGVGNTGGLVGFSRTTFFDNCTASGTVTGNGQYTGGLIGQNIDDMGSNSVVYCSSSCLVYGYDNYTGGLIGMNESAMINHSNATGYVSINIASFAPGNAYAGGLIGYNNNSTISNSYAECNVDAYFNTSMAGAHNVYTGGLIGYNTMGIEESHAIGIVTTEIDGSDTKIVYSGGLVGRNYSDITLCYFDGEVRADNGTPSQIYAGGLVGYYTGGVTMSQCFSDGIVRADKPENLAAGGLVGYNVNTIDNSYSLCNVQAAGDCAGGFVGYNGGAITNCYSAGPVSSSSANHGGFCGFDDGGSYPSCYYDEDYSGQSDTGKGDPVEHTLMLDQGTYAGWDFPPPTGSIWLIDSNNGGYPYLCWNWPY